MSMTYQDFLTRVIDEGIAEVRKHYEKEPHKRDGAVAGFEACRGKNPSEIMTELTSARTACRAAMDDGIEGDTHLGDYWRLRYKELQIEWVANVLSAAFVSNGISPLMAPTARGMMMAARVLGVEGESLPR